jgi:hypothetical protein
MSVTTRASLFALAILFPGGALANDDGSRYPEGVPSDLDVAADEKLIYVTEAEGVQIYDCILSGDVYAWTFRAPEAILYSEGAGELGIHYAGPTWESNSGGTVVAAVAAKVSSPDPDAIPWLRLTAVSNSGGGPFKKVTTIQRLYTIGGVAPSSGCDASTVGAEADVPYEATYYFYKL